MGRTRRSTSAACAPTDWLVWISGGGITTTAGAVSGGARRRASRRVGRPRHAHVVDVVTGDLQRHLLEVVVVVGRQLGRVAGPVVLGNTLTITVEQRKIAPSRPGSRRKARTAGRPERGDRRAGRARPRSRRRCDRARRSRRRWRSGQPGPARWLQRRSEERAAGIERDRRRPRWNDRPPTVVDGHRRSPRGRSGPWRRRAGRHVLGVDIDGQLVTRRRRGVGDHHRLAAGPPGVATVRVLLVRWRRIELAVRR